MPQPPAETSTSTWKNPQEQESEKAIKVEPNGQNSESKDAKGYEPESISKAAIEISKEEERGERSNPNGKEPSPSSNSETKDANESTTTPLGNRPAAIDTPLLPVKSEASSQAAHTLSESIPRKIMTHAQSPLRPIQDQPLPLSNPEVPALLLRMGPAVTGSEPDITNYISVVPSTSLDLQLPPRPEVDTWVAPEVAAIRTRTDVYIPPSSPLFHKPGDRPNTFRGRRREQSPGRTPRDESGKGHLENSGWGNAPTRDRSPGSWREEHLPSKRRRSDEYGHNNERLESRHHRDLNNSRSEESSHPRQGDSAHHHHHRRDVSAERRRYKQDRAASEERRNRRKSDHRDDRRAKVDVEERRDVRNGRDAASNGNGWDRDTRDMRNGNGGGHVKDLISRRRYGDESERAFGDDKYSRKSEDMGRVSRTGTSGQAADVSSRLDDRRLRDDQRSHTNEHQREAIAEDSKEHSHRKEYEGGKAQSMRESRNGIANDEILKRDTQLTNGHDRHQGTNATRQPSVGPQTLGGIVGQRAFPYQRPSSITTARTQRPYGPPNMRSARSATTGSNADPITARRGFDSPQASASPAGAQSPYIFQHAPPSNTPKDTLQPPLQDNDYIIAKYAAQTNLVKPVWIENPKAPVANFLTGGKGGANGLGPRGPAYRISTGRLGGKGITRAMLPIVGHPSILGVGDDPIRVQAEKLACLSALFQLVEAGLMKGEERPAADPLESLESAEADDPDSEEVTQLSTGETITLREARSFMDYYCKRFGFGQPEISYETVAMRAGPQKWEAIMEVGGKKIGLGAGTTKKMATRVCYLDVTSYLEKCDQALWREYLTFAKAQGN